MLTNTYFERRVGQILDIAGRFARALDRAGIPYRVVGGLGVFLHIERVDPPKARLTRDVDVAIDRAHLDEIKRAVAVAGEGFAYRHAAGVDMFVDAVHPTARSAVFIRKRVRLDYLEPVPGFSEPVRGPQGILIAPVADLVRMKLTSFRLRDRVHIQDLDSAGLITPAVEASLSEPLRARARCGPRERVVGTLQRRAGHLPQSREHSASKGEAPSLNLQHPAAKPPALFCEASGRCSKALRTLGARVSWSERVP